MANFKIIIKNYKIKPDNTEPAYLDKFLFFTKKDNTRNA